MSSKQSVAGAPLEDTTHRRYEWIARWSAEVSRELETYHDIDTPFKSIEDSDDYGAYPPQKVPLQHLLSGRLVKADILDGFEGPLSGSEGSDDEKPDHATQRPPVSKEVQKHKRDSQEPQEEPSTKRQCLDSRVSSPLRDGLPDRARRAKFCGDLSNSLKESTPRPLLSYERQPRRKTREDKYEPKVADLPSKSRRVIKACKTSRPSYPDLRDFKAPNVRQHRLTLKSGQHLGIFSKGKASSPIRRRRLPDLSFPEMNFLSGRKDRHVEPVFAGVVRQLSKKKTEQDKISEFFSRPLMNRTTGKQVEGSPRRRIADSPAHSPRKSVPGMEQATSAPLILSKIASVSPQKSWKSQGRGVYLLPSNQENLGLRSVQHSLRHQTVEEAEADHMDRLTVYLPWSTSNVTSQKPFRQPLADTSKKYLSLDDLHQLLKRRQAELEDEERVASSPVHRDNESKHIIFDNHSQFRDAEYRMIPSVYYRSGRQDNVKLQPYQENVVNHGTTWTRGLPQMYAEQLVEQEGFEVFEDPAASGEDNGRRQHVPGGLRQYGTRNGFHDDLSANQVATTINSPYKTWMGPRTRFGDDEAKASIFKSSKSEGWTRYGDSPQKNMAPIRGRELEPRRSYGGFFGDDTRRLLEGGGRPFMERLDARRHGGLLDTAGSVFQQTEQEVNAELLAKGFWRRQRL